MSDKALVVRTEMDVMSLGKVLVASNFFQDSKDAAQAVVKVIAGQELGFGPIASMTGIYIVKGRVTLSANLMAAAIKRAGKYNYRIKEHTDTTCALEFYEDGQIVGESVFTIQDAKKAGLGGENWNKYPKNMLFARALSNGAKWYCPDVFGGPIYTPDEMGAQYDAETGEVIEGTFAPATTTTTSEVTPPDQEPDASAQQEPPAPPAPKSALVEAFGEKDITDAAKSLARSTCPWDASVQRKPWQEFIASAKEWHKKFWPGVAALGLDEGMAHHALNVTSMKEWNGEGSTANTVGHLWYALALASVEASLTASESSEPDADAA